jgi:hypothetical protein
MAHMIYTFKIENYLTGEMFIRQAKVQTNTNIMSVKLVAIDEAIPFAQQKTRA